MRRKAQAIVGRISTFILRELRESVNSPRAEFDPILSVWSDNFMSVVNLPAQLLSGD